MKKILALFFTFAITLTLIPADYFAGASTPALLPGTAFRLPGAQDAPVTITDIYDNYQWGSSNSNYPDVINAYVFEVRNTSTIMFSRAGYFEWSINSGLSWYPARLMSPGEILRLSDFEYVNHGSFMLRTMLGTTSAGGEAVSNEAFFRIYGTSGNSPRGVSIKGSGSVTSLAVTPEMVSAAHKLHTLGLFLGIGQNADGTPNFDLGRPTGRAEAITMFVRLLGKENEATNGTWSTPFNDLVSWMRPYVGYAYTNGLTQGTGPTTFGTGNATATQYLTFVLRALGYTSGVDFQWDSAWILTDSLGITNGSYNAFTPTLLRGDAAIVSFDALSAVDRNSGKALYEILIEEGAITREAAVSVGLGA